MEVDWCLINDFENIDEALGEGIGRYCLQDGCGWEFEVPYQVMKKLQYNYCDFIITEFDSLTCYLMVDPTESCGGFSDDEDKHQLIKHVLEIETKF